MKLNALTMTLDYPLDSCNLFQCVNVLGVVAKEFSLFVHQSDELVTERWLELSRVDLLGNSAHIRHGNGYTEPVTELDTVPSDHRVCHHGPSLCPLPLLWIQVLFLQLSFPAWHDELLRASWALFFIQHKSNV